MSNPFDQFDVSEAGDANPFDQFDAPAEQKPKSGIARRLLGDTAITAVKGAIGLTEVPVGIADIATGGRAGKALEGIGYRPKEAKSILDDWYSPEQKAANKAVQEADGFVGTLKAAAQNPSTIGHGVVESLPLLLPGAAAARGIAAATKAPAWAAGAMGEGIVGAGLAAEQLRQNADDGLMDAQKSAAALASGAGTALFGAAGGRLAQSAIGKKIGLSDIDTSLAMTPAQRAAGQAAQGGIAKRIGAGAVSEGLLEEMPQSMWEQAAQNFGEGRDLGEGVAEAGAMGLITGGVMGGGFNAIPGSKYIESKRAPTEDQPIAGLLPAPTMTGTPSEQMLQSEVDRQNAVDAAQKNADQIYAERAAYQEELAKLYPSGLPTITRETRTLQQFIDETIVSLGNSDLKGLRKVQRQKQFEAALKEVVGITHDENGREIPLTMGALLDSQAMAEDAAKRRVAAENAGIRAQQLADEEMQQPDVAAPSIPVVGPLSAAANVAVQSGASQAMAMQQAAASVSNQAKSDTQGGISRAAQTSPLAQAPAQANDAQVGAQPAAAPKAQGVALQTQAQPGTTSPIQQSPTPLSIPPEIVSRVAKRTDKELAFMGKVNRDPVVREAVAQEMAIRAADSGRSNEQQAAAGLPDATAGESRPAPAAPERRGIKTIDKWTADELQARLDRADVSPLTPESEQRIRAELAKKQPTKKVAESGLRVGKTPNASEPVTVRNGVVFIGDYPAMDYDTEADITVPEGATNQQIADAINKGGAIGSRKIFGLKAEADQNPIKNEAPAAATVPSESATTEQGAIKKEDQPARTRMTPLNDQRITKYAGDLRAMSADAGWAEEGGRLLIDADGKKTRTVWIPRAQWFMAGMINSPKEVLAAVNKASNNWPMSAKEKRTVSAMMDFLDSQNEGTEQDVSDSDVLAEVGYDEQTAQYQEIVDLLGDFDIDAPGALQDEAAAMSALGFTETEINEITQGKPGNPQGSAGEADATAAEGSQERVSGRNEAGQGQQQEGQGFSLAAQTNDQAAEQFAQQQAAKDKEAADKKAADDKAKADAEANDFRLAGSDRAADVAVAGGQVGLFGANGQPTKNADQSPAADTKKQEEPKPAEDGKPANQSDEVSDSVPRQYNTMADVDSAIEGIFDGTVSLADYKAAFNGLMANKDAITAELGKMTIPQLHERFGKQPYGRPEKKGEIVERAFEIIRNAFALRRSFGPNSYTMSAGGLAKFESDKLAALTDMVNASTAEDLKAFADEIGKTRAARQEKIEGAQDPKTIEDFDNALRLKKAEGMTFAEARMSLTPEQRAEYDRLKGIASRDQRKARADQQKTEVRVASQTTEGQVIETKHTKTGAPLFVVKAAERVDRDVYALWNATAKRMGGYYSAFRGNGAVPGFQFKTRENADAFLAFIGGNAEAAKEAVQERRDAFADDRSQSAVERLNEMAERLEEKADESLGRERKANTERRARFAASAEAAANAEKAMAKTMRRIAEAISSGAAQFLDRVRQKAQIEYLASVLRTAKDSELRTKYPSYADQEKHKGEPATGETADYAEFPQYAMMRSDLANLARKMVTLPNMKMLGQRILKVADDTSAAYTAFAKEHLLEVSRFGKADGSGWATFSTLKAAERSIEVSNLAAVAVPLQIKRGEYRIVLSPSEAINRGIWKGDDRKIYLSADIGEEIVEKLGKLNRKYGKRRGMDAPPEAPWQFENAYNNRKRLAGMGIEQPWEFRAALREFASLKEAPKEADKIKAMERAMIGRKNDGLDFFPTPAETAQAMIDAAEVQEGMSVLEPSAGMGHIAEQIRDVAGIDPDVIEFNSDRRELLEAKGFNVIGQDFLDLTPRSFTYGDVFRDKDGVEGIMRGSGGMGSNRVGFVPLGKDERMREWRDRDELTGVRKSGYNSGYDRIIMNPPFSNRRDAEHVQHAYSLLKPGGRVVAIMGEGVFFGQDKKAIAFREWLDEVGGTSEKLDEGTFLDPSLPVNTGTNARMVVIDKPAGESAPVGNEGAGNIATPATISPADKAIYGMAVEGKPAAEILKFIASASRSPFNRQVAKLLLKTGINPTITVGDGKGWKFNAGEGNNYAAGYDPKKNMISLFKPGAAERNMLHELIHAATIKALGKKGLASAQMKALFKHVEKNGKSVGLFYDQKTKRGIYGMANIDEFIAEAFSNPKFQALLKQVSAPKTPGNPLSSAWNWFSRIVRGILGLPMNTESALSQALEIGVEVMREDVAIRRAENAPENAGIAQRNDAVNRMIEQWAAGELKSGVILDLGKPSRILKRFGVPDLPVTLTQRVLIKAVREKHDVEVGDLKDLVVNIQAPIAVFKSKKGNGKIIAVTEARHADGNIVVALDLDVTRDSIDINDVRSIYPKRDSSVANWIADGLLIGADKHKGSDWLENSAGSNSQQPQVNAALDKAILYDGRLIRKAAEEAVIRYAQGNNGNFDATNPDIRYNVADEGWSVSEPSKMDDLIYALQDKQVDLKRVMQSIMQTGKKVKDEVNAYLQEELFHGRAAKGVKDFLDFELRPLLKEMQAAKVDMGDFEEYLWNRHAEERNKQIAKVNPEMPDGGSGINTADARAYLAGLTADQKRVFESLAAKVEAMNRSSQAILVSSGLEKQETIDAWNGAYKHYVPLQREDVDSGHVGTGKGFSVRGSSTKRAMGSGKKVVDIIANLTMQRERNIVRAEKNRVSNALLGLAIENPNPEFWKVDQAPKERVVEETAIYTVLDANGKKIEEFTRMSEAERLANKTPGSTIDQTWGDRVNERITPGFKNRDNVILTRINGEDHYIILNERDERAMRLSASMKNLDMDNMGRALSIVGKATRYLASVNTQYNPVFGVINLIRDVQGALLNLQSTQIAGEQKRVAGYTVDALRGIYADIRAHRAGKVPSSNWAKLFEEFQKEGGQTGYRDQYANAEARAEAIVSELKQFNEGKPKRMARAVFGWLSDYNETMENAVRLAAYKTAKEKGLSNQQAASIAKNLTVNFNRKGQMTTQIGALYAFFNASVQGTARLAETLFEKNDGDPKKIRLSKLGKQIITGGIMLGSMQALLLAAAGFDDDEPPEFIRERNLILPIGDGKYLTLAMPLGFHVIPGIGRIATEFALSGFKDPAKRTVSMLGMFAETFNPIGSAGLSIQTLTPSVVDPFAALAENRDFTGREIYRENFNANDPSPGHARAKDVATVWSRYLSEAINFITGGTEFKPGAFSPSPDAIDYLIAQAGGGVMREANKVGQTAGAAYTGDDLPLYKIPLVGRFVGDTEGQSGNSQKFYNAVREINMHEREVKGLREAGRADEARAYIAENPVYRMSMMANSTERQVRKLRDVRRKASEDGDADKVRVINDQITGLMTRFNERAAPLLEQ